MIAPTNTLSWATDIVIIEFVILAILLIIILTGSLLYERRWRKTHRNIAELESILAKLIKEQIDTFEHFLPSHLRKLSFIVPIIEKIDKNLSGIYWEFFKEKLIHILLKDELTSYLKSRLWNRRSWALRTLYISPRSEYESFILKSLKDKKTLLRFTAAKCAVQLKTKTAIRATLEAMSKEFELCQYPYQDAILASGLRTFQYVAQIFHEKANEPLKLAILKILSQKTGYILYEDLKEELYSSNLELRWWAARALANSPTKEGVSCLISLTQDPQWQIQALACHLLGLLHATAALSSLEKNLNNFNYWVSYASAISLRVLGEKGMDILKNQRPYPNETAFKTAQHVLKLPPISLKKGIQVFFPREPGSLLLPHTIKRT